MFPVIPLNEEKFKDKILRWASGSVKGSNIPTTDWPQVLSEIYLISSGHQVNFLFCSIDSNRLKSFVVIIFGIINIIRYAFVTAYPSNPRVLLFGGALFNAFGSVGRTLHLTSLFSCLQMTIFRIIFMWKDMKDSNIFHEIHMERHKNISVTNPFLAIKLAMSANFLSNNTIRITNNLASVTIHLCEALILYPTIVSINRRSNWVGIIFDVFWLLVSETSIRTLIRDSIWIFGWWLSMVEKLCHETDALVQQVLRESSSLQIKNAREVQAVSHNISVDVTKSLGRIHEKYLLLIRRCNYFNEVSKHVIFYMACCSTVINASVMYSYLRMEDTLIAPGFLIFWLIMSFLSFLAMATTTILYHRNCRLYRQLNSFFVRCNSFMSVQNKMELQQLIESTGCQSRCFVALAMIDGEFFKKRSVIRYAFYCTRMYAFMINFADQWT